MRILTLPTLATLLADICVWLILHMGISKWLTTWDLKRFNPKCWIYLERGWEDRGNFYRKRLEVNSWKKWLPDAAPWFKGGFAKKNLSSSSKDYLERFVLETCRGELTHWLTMGCFPVFFLWNKPWVGGIMILYAGMANLPCIITQRFNRIRLSCLLKK